MSKLAGGPHSLSDDETFELQRRLLLGTLVHVEEGSGGAATVAPQPLPLKFVGSSSSGKVSSIPKGCDRSSGFDATCTSSTSTVSLSKRRDVPQVPLRMAPHKKMASYIYDLKGLYKQEVDAYTEFAERVRRGRAARDASDAETNHTFALDDYAEKVKLSVAEKLAYADMVVQNVHDASAASIHSILHTASGLGASSSASFLLASTSARDVPTAPRSDIPAELEKVINDAKLRRAGASMRHSQQTSGAAGGSSVGFALSFSRGVVRVERGASSQASTVQVGCPPAVAHEQSDCSETGDIVGGKMEASVVFDSDDGRVLVSSDDVVLQGGKAESLRDDRNTTPSAAEVWFEDVVEKSCQPGCTDVILIDESAGELQLARHLDDLAIEAGLMERAVGDAAKVVTHPPRAPSVVVVPRRETHAGEILNGVRMTECEAEGKGIEVRSAARNPGSPLVVQSFDLESPVSERTASPLGQPSTAYHTKPYSSATGEAERTTSPVPQRAGRALQRSVSIVDVELPRDEAAVSHSQSSGVAARSSVMSTTTAHSSSSGKSLPRTPSVVWSSKTCSCESTFHSIKQKMFEDTNRAVKVRYVSAFVSQIESFANEVVEWRDAVAKEMNRLADYIAVLIDERAQGERECAHVAAEMSAIRRSLVATNDDTGVARGGPHHRQQQNVHETGNDGDGHEVASVLSSARGNDVSRSPREVGDDPTNTHNMVHSQGHRVEGDIGEHDDAPYDASDIHYVSIDENPVPALRDPHIMATPEGLSRNVEKPEPEVLRRSKSLLGTLKVDWDRFMAEHSPIKKSLDHVERVNAALEQSSMFLHDTYVLYNRAGAAFANAAVVLPPHHGRRTSVVQESPESSIYDVSPPPGSPTQGKLRMVSTRLVDCSTQTVSDEDYFFDNAESVMLAGSTHQEEFARKASAVMLSVSMASPVGKKGDNANGDTTTVEAMDKIMAAMTSKLLQSIASMQVHLSVDPPLLAPSGEDDREPTPLEVAGAVVPQTLASLVDSVKQFCKDIVHLRPKRLASSMVRSVGVTEWNAQCELLDDGLRQRLHHFARDCNRLCASVTDMLSSTVVSALKGAAESAKRADKLSSMITEVENESASLRQKVSELETANAALEEKQKKALAAAAVSKMKQDKSKEGQLLAQKDLQLNKAVKVADELRKQLGSVHDMFQSFVMNCCRNGQNTRLADALNTNIFSSSPPPATTNYDVVHDVIVRALQFLNDSKATLHTTQFPDPLWLQLNYDIGKVSDEVLSTLRMNKLDVPLEIMDAVSSQNKVWTPAGPHETEAEFFTRAKKSNSSSSMDRSGVVATPILDGGDDRRTTIPAYLLKSGLSPQDLFTSVAAQVKLVNDMMALARSQLPTQRRQLIAPFAVAIRRLLHDAKEDVRFAASTIEWYLLKKEKQKELLKGEEEAKPFGDPVEDPIPSNESADGDEGNTATASADLAASVSMAASLSLRSVKSFATSRVECIDDGNDNPLPTLLRHLDAYRKTSDSIVDLFSEKKMAITSEQTLGSKIKSFAVDEHGPFSTRLRRNVKDVMGRVIAIVEGKNLATALQRDACEGTLDISYTASEVQATWPTLEKGTVYEEEDFEPWEGDEDEIAAAFSAFDKNCMPSKNLPEAFLLEGRGGEDYVGVVHEAQPMENNSFVSLLCDNPLLQEKDHHTPRSKTYADSSPTKASLGSLTIEGIPCHQESPATSTAPMAAAAAQQHQEAKRKKNRSVKSTFTQTTADAKFMEVLFNRLPMADVFLFATQLDDALLEMEKLNPVCATTQALQAELAQVRRLYEFRRGKQYSELGHQMLRLIGRVLALVLSDVKDRPRFAAVLKPPLASATVGGHHKKSAVCEAGVQVSVVSCGIGVMVEGSSGSGGYVDALEEEEHAKHSFVPLFDLFARHLDAFRQTTSTTSNGGLGTGRVGPTTMSSSPTTKPTPPETLSVENIDLGLDTGRRHRTPTSDTFLTSSFSAAPRLALPAAQAAACNPERLPLPSRGQSRRASTAEQAFTHRDVESLLKLEDNILLPLRRAVFRFLNEPPFTLPPDRGASHPKQAFTSAALQREICAIGHVHRCLQQYASMSSSYRITVIRAVGARCRLREWERLRSEVEGVGLETISEHSKTYKFLTARPPLMNARARREEQQRLKEERSAGFLRLLQARSDACQAEVQRLANVAQTLKRQSEEQVVSFLREYYLPPTTTAGVVKTTKTAVGATPPPAACAVAPIATVLPKYLSTTTLEPGRAHQTLSAVIALLWRDARSGTAASFEDDPKSRSWFDRTGTSQGGLRSHRLDDSHQLVAARDEAYLTSANVNAMQADYFRNPQHHPDPRMHDFFGLSTTTVGFKTVASSHLLFSGKRKQGFVVPSLAYASVSNSIQRGGSVGPPLLLRPLCEMEDEFSGGVKVKGWKGGLVHLDGQCDAAVGSHDGASGVPQRAATSMSSHSNLHDATKSIARSATSMGQQARMAEHGTLSQPSKLRSTDIPLSGDIQSSYLAGGAAALGRGNKIQVSCSSAPRKPSAGVVLAPLQAPEGL